MLSDYAEATPGYSHSIPSSNQYLTQLNDLFNDHSPCTVCRDKFSDTLWPLILKFVVIYVKTNPPISTFLVQEPELFSALLGLFYKNWRCCRSSSEIIPVNARSYCMPAGGASVSLVSAYSFLQARYGLTAKLWPYCLLYISQAHNNNINFNKNLLANVLNIQRILNLVLHNQLSTT